MSKSIQTIRCRLSLYLACLVVMGFLLGNNSSFAEGVLSGVSTTQKKQMVESYLKGDIKLSPQQESMVSNNPEIKKELSKLSEGVTDGKESLQQLESIGESVSKSDIQDISNKEEATVDVENKAEINRRIQSSPFDLHSNINRYQRLSTKLKPFGYRFFQGTMPLGPKRGLPVPDEYILGPGDEVKITLWGRVGEQYNLTVDNSGNITIPDMGPIAIAGMSFKEAKALLTSKAKQIVGTEVHVAMGTLKTIQVFVLGEVNKPGSYNLNSFSTIVNALIASRGPSNIGSLRKIHLKRDGNTIATLDFYDLLLYGNMKQDKMLRAGDVIYVPPVGPLVGIAGNVKRPAIYELNSLQDLEALLTFAGGITPSADTQQIQVRRLQNNKEQILVDLNYKEFSNARNFQLQDGDLVKIFSIVDRNLNAVYLSGNVKRPGKYEYKKGMGVRELISGIDELMDETYLDYAVVKRLEPPQNEVKLIPFSLRKLLLDPTTRGQYTVKLKPRDKIFVFSRWLFEEKSRVSIEGQVRKPGTYLLDANMTVKDLILTAQGVTDNTFYEKAELYRGDLTLRTINLEKALEGDPAENLILDKDDRLVIHSLDEYYPLYDVSIEGEVKAPGAFFHAVNMRVKDLIFAAKGLKDFAYLAKAELYRFDEESLKTRLITFNLENALDGVPEDNILLQGRDRIVIHSLKEFDHSWLYKVNIEGEVIASGSYSYAENMRVKDLVFAAKGLKEFAYLDKAELYRFDEETLKTRLITFNLENALEGVPEDNILLQGRDRIVIHSLKEFDPSLYVTILGAVHNPGAIPFATGMTVKDLIFAGKSLTETAYLDDAELASYEIIDGREVRVDYKSINLQKAMEDDPQHNVVLKGRDKLLIRNIPEWADRHQVVTLAGEFRFPGNYHFQKGEKLSSVIERAGGFSKDAYLRGVVFTREKLKKKQQADLNMMIEKLEMQIFRSEIQKSDQVKEGSSMAEKEAFINKLRQVKAKGRLTIWLTDLERFRGSPYDVELDDGDAILLPSSNNTVSVAGSVMSSATYLYEKGEDAMHYISMSGGFSENANSDYAYVLKVDGSAHRLNGSGDFLSFFDSSRRTRTPWGERISAIESGDTIIVPEELEHIDWLATVKDIAQVLMNIAVTAGTAVRLF